MGMSRDALKTGLIDELVAELTPVRAMRSRDGMFLTLGAAALAAALVVVLTGMRDEVLHPMFFLRTGALLLLGLTSSYAVIAMCQPAVGNSFKGWVWALIAALLFPATAALMLMTGMPDDMAVLNPRFGLECMAVSFALALGIAAVEVVWLRRGAPVALERAGWLVGISSGALGAVAYNLHCPFNSIFYIGLWYTLAVAICAVLGRLIVPHLIRW